MNAPLRKWVVFSTCVGDCTLLVQDKSSGEYGIVPFPSIEEWQKAFHAFSSPYLWDQPERVVPLKNGKPIPSN
jgi:hypothetical protein